MKHLVEETVERTGAAAALGARVAAAPPGAIARQYYWTQLNVATTVAPC